MNAFEDRLAKAVTRAEEALRKAEARLGAALREYDAEVARREERGDGFTSTSYLVKRREAVLARKFYEAKRSALSTAIARRDAPRLGGSGCSCKTRPGIPKRLPPTPPWAQRGPRCSRTSALSHIHPLSRSRT